MSTNRMFTPVAPVVEEDTVSLASKLVAKAKTYVQDTKEDVSYLEALHSKQRDVLFARRQARIAAMKP